MAEDAYKNALAKKQRLLRELEEVNNFLKLYQRFTPKGQAKPEPAAASHNEEPVDKTASGKKVSVPAKFEPIIRHVLLIAGRALPRSMLLKKLEENGTPIPGKNPSKNLGTIMWRLRDQFTNIEGFGYWVAGVTNDAAHYIPEGGISIQNARLSLEAWQ